MPQTKLLAVARPLFVGKRFSGTIVVAKPETVLAQRWLALIERLLIAFAGGVLVAAAFAWYSSRRITTPVLQLSAAADEVAHGNYDVEVPSGGAGEIGVLAERFGEMASRLGEAEELERNFLMTVSHELRTPLTAIRGHVGALREGVVTDDELRAASLTVIAAEAERLERLVGDVLDLAKLDAHRFTVLQEEVDMERLVDRAYVTFSEEARRRGIDYRREVEAKPVIVSDGDRVLQIITNLLSNAFRWTPDGGRVDLELSATDGSVYVGVADSGPGIAPSERERIFRPFWSRGGGGTGPRPGDRARARGGARRPDQPRELGRAGQPLRADAADAPQIASARGCRARARRAAAPPLAAASRARGAAPAAVVEEPARLRRPRLRGQARRPAPLAGGVRLLRRLLRDLERVVPGQRRARPARRPAAPGQALAADRPR